MRSVSYIIGYYSKKVLENHLILTEVFFNLTKDPKPSDGTQNIGKPLVTLYIYIITQYIGYLPKKKKGLRPFHDLEPFTTLIMSIS